MDGAAARAAPGGSTKNNLTDVAVNNIFCKSEQFYDGARIKILFIVEMVVILLFFL